MATWIWIVIAVVVVLCGAVVIQMFLARRRTRRLQERFGPEYDRTEQVPAGDARQRPSSPRARHGTTSSRFGSCRPLTNVGTPLRGRTCRQSSSIPRWTPFRTPTGS